MKNIIRTLFVLISLSLVLNHPMHREYMKSLLNKPIDEQFKIWHYVMNKPYSLFSSVAEKKLNIDVIDNDTGMLA